MVSFRACPVAAHSGCSTSITFLLSSPPSITPWFSLPWRGVQVPISGPHHHSIWFSSSEICIANKPPGAAAPVVQRLLLENPHLPCEEEVEGLYSQPGTQGSSRMDLSKVKDFKYLLYYNWHNKKFTHFKVYGLISFSKFTELCNHLHNPVLQYSHYSKKFSWAICGQSVSTPSSRQPLVCFLSLSFVFTRNFTYMDSYNLWSFVASFFWSA